MMTAAAVVLCGSATDSAGSLWTQLSAAAVEITAAASAAGCNTAACTARSADPAAAESMPLATESTHTRDWL